MENYAMMLLCIIVAIVWFMCIIMYAKKHVGKEAKNWQMFTYLFVAGPLGWATVLIIMIADMLERAFPSQFPAKKDKQDDR